MKKHIKQLVEKLFNDIYNEDEFSTDNIASQISDELSYNYHPKTKDELRNIIEDKLAENKNADLNDIDVSRITNMSDLFTGLDPHNINIKYWNVSNVKDMSSMFFICKNFNCDLSNWDVSNVENMNSMFYGCKNFTGEGLENWKTIKCIKMDFMFSSCENLNCNLSNWDVSNVETMCNMFCGCLNFKGEGLENWKPIKCKDMYYMFDDCPSLKNKPKWYKK